MNNFRFVGNDLLFFKNKTENNSENLKIPYLECMGKLGAYISLRIATKNLKKFLVILHHKMCFHAFFRMSKNTRELWGRKFLIIDFFPCYLWEIEGSGANSKHPILATLTMKVSCFRLKLII